MADCLTPGDVTQVVLLISPPFIGQEWFVHQYFPDYRHFSLIHPTVVTGFQPQPELEFVKDIVTAIKKHGNHVVIDHPDLWWTANVFQQKLETRVGSSRTIEFKHVTLQAQGGISQSFWLASWHHGYLLRRALQQNQDSKTWNPTLPHVNVLEYLEERVASKPKAPSLGALALPMFVPKLYTGGLPCIYIDYDVICSEHVNDAFSKHLLAALKVWMKKVRAVLPRESPPVICILLDSVHNEHASAYAALADIICMQETTPQSQETQAEDLAPSSRALLAALARDAVTPVFFARHSRQMQDLSAARSMNMVAITMAALLGVDLNHACTVYVASTQDKATMAQVLGCQCELWDEVKKNPTILRADITNPRRRGSVADSLVLQRTYASYCHFTETGRHDDFHNTMDAPVARFYEPLCCEPTASASVPLLLRAADQRTVLLAGMQVGYCAEGSQNRMLDRFKKLPDERLSPGLVLTKLQTLSGSLVAELKRGRRDVYNAATPPDGDDNDDNDDDGTGFTLSLRAISTLLGDGRAVERAEDVCPKLYDLYKPQAATLVGWSEGSKGEVYRVECQLLQDGSLRDSLCSCKFQAHGQRVCKHRGALLLVQHYDPAAFASKKPVSRTKLRTTKLPFVKPEPLPVPEMAPQLHTPPRDTMAIRIAKVSPRLKPNANLVRPATSSTIPPPITHTNAANPAKRRNLPAILNTLSSHAQPKAKRSSSAKPAAKGKTSKPASKPSRAKESPLDLEGMRDLCRTILLQGWEATGFVSGDFEDSVAQTFGHVRHAASSQASQPPSQPPSQASDKGTTAQSRLLHDGGNSGVKATPNAARSEPRPAPIVDAVADAAKEQAAREALAALFEDPDLHLDADEADLLNDEDWF